MKTTFTLELPEDILDGNWHKFSAWFKAVEGETVVYYPQVETQDFNEEIKHVARYGHKNLTYEKLMKRKYGGWDWISRH